MHRQVLVGVLLAFTSLVVLVPVVTQVLREGYRWRQVWGHLVFAGGLLVVGIAYGLIEGPAQAWIAGAGFLAAVVGMVAQQRMRD